MAELDDGEVPQLTISTSADPGGPPVVSLAGELDSSNVDRLRPTVDALVASAPERVVFDLSQLRFMDSAGISVLVRLAAEVKTVQIRDPSPIVRRVIELTGLTGVLQVDS